MKDKLILFDWGNIVESQTTGYSNNGAWIKLFKACGYECDETIFPMISKYRLSAIENIEKFEETYNQMAKDFGFNKTFAEFCELYKKYFDKIDYYKNVADFEKSLRDKCSIGILSNLTIFDKERLNKQVDLSKYDYSFLSFELGMKKPDLDIYQTIQNKVPFKPEDILFIDDRTDNIESAQKMGWNTFQTTGLEFEKLKNKCEEFLK